MTHSWLATLRPRLVLAVALLALAGCQNNLDQIQLVKSPRILAIVADPPEAAPGEDVDIRVLSFDPMHRDIHYRFEFCIDPARFLGGAPSDGTGGQTAMMPYCVSLAAHGNTATVPGELTAVLVQMIDSLPSGGPFSADTLRTVLGTAGIPVEVNVTMSVDDESTGTTITVLGTKLFGLTTRDDPTTDPPYVYLAIGDTMYIGGFAHGDDFECVPWFGAPATFVASPATGALTSVTLAPADDPSVWEESFPIYDFSGNVRRGYEGAYYSWYSTASFTDEHGRQRSTLATDTTQGPAHGAAPSDADATMRNVTWGVPRDPGTYDLWLVVRDGHLGETACHTSIEVTPPP